MVRQRLNGLLILDPLEDRQGRRYDLHRDSSHLLSLELERRGHAVHLAAPHDLAAVKDKILIRSRRVSVLAEAPYFSVLKETTRDASHFDFIWMRKDPPFDANYLYATQLLSLAARKTRVLNDPQALRDGNEKLWILNFPRWIPPTFVTSDPAAIASFAEKWPEGAVLKPLEGFAGHGIVFVRNGTKKIGLAQATQDETRHVLLQKYLPGIRHGEKRIFVVDGEPLGALLKIPASKHALANPDRGARLAPAVLSTRENRLARDVGRFLKARDVFFAGLDVIGGFLTEINITSPGLLWEWNETDGRRHERDIIDRLESWIQRTRSIRRKS